MRALAIAADDRLFAQDIAVGALPLAVLPGGDQLHQGCQCDKRTSLFGRWQNVENRAAVGLVPGSSTRGVDAAHTDDYR